MERSVRNGLRGLVFFFTSMFFVLAALSAYALELKCDNFKDGGDIPAKYTYIGQNISPALKWSDVPEGTKSFALIVDDPDAPLATWIHWVIFDIPGTAKGLPEGIGKEITLKDGTKQGLNSFRQTNYDGPAPPPGPAHRYVFTLYAVDKTLDDVPAMSNKGEVLRAIQGHILAEARIIAKFGRK
jgi:Raf kinase inhibitor-like YbhB/YbcL family protein